ncbi:hypothetical protein M758_UG284900 [Ceratodon purpureus]|nr:hypothetical protein M758_UG284900 [Ceratodon purpureus]
MPATSSSTVLTASYLNTAHQQNYPTNPIAKSSLQTLVISVLQQNPLTVSLCCCGNTKHEIKKLLYGKKMWRKKTPTHNGSS